MVSLGSDAGVDAGRDARAHLYQATAKLLEVSGATSLDELRAQLVGIAGGEGTFDHPATSASGEPQCPRGPDPVVSEKRH